MRVRDQELRGKKKKNKAGEKSHKVERNASEDVTELAA